MSDPEGPCDTQVFVDTLPVEDVWKAGRAAVRERQQRFYKNLPEVDPSLAALLVSEAARFDIVSRTVIEPTMRGVADEAARRGWHVDVVRDDMDRLSLFATPGIRFYCSRRAFPTPAVDLMCPPAFILFYGCTQSRAVRTHIVTEVETDAFPSHDETRLAYPEVTREAVRAVLVAFLDDLEHTGAEVTRG